MSGAFFDDDGRVASLGNPAGVAKPGFVLERYSDIGFDAAEEWLVKGILPRKGVGAIYGQAESLKSFLAVDLSFHIAAGVSWAAQRVDQAAVVYIAAEGAAGLRKRKVGFQIANPTFPADLPFSLISAAPNLGTEQGDVQLLIEAIHAAGVTPGLIVIDTLAQTLGAGDENGAGMSMFIANAGFLAGHFGCAVLVIHHVGLADDQRLRGHSSLRGALDVQILTERVKGTLAATMTLKKMKDEASDRTFSALLSRVVIGTDEDAGEISTLVIDSITETAAKAANIPSRSVPASARMLMDVTTAALDEAGSDMRPMGQDGPLVRAVDEKAIRTRYYARIAEAAEPGEDPDKLSFRQRKAFNRAIEAGVKANRIMATSRDNHRFIWLP